ncbi:MAG TPA: lipase family protein [Prolixibacteraceae bacterium]|nr:lipase family protein [Prolixibacteraceae bacterium]HPR61809.1 lipase family protein [Prolixibacteraceae bacterium]
MEKEKIKKIYWPLMLFLATAMLFSACDKDDNDDDITPKYLVDNETFSPAIPATVENIKSAMNTFGVTALTENVKYDVNIYKLIYKTLFEGDSILVSGVVATPVPKKNNEEFPILSYQHGTIFTKAEAPSVNTNNEFMTYLASTGMVIVIADYIGFGASNAEFHPYLHKQYTVNAVLDMIRASIEFVKIEKPCKINDQLFMFGYSQGGGATVAAMEAIENNADNNDLAVTAASAGSGAYDMAGFRSWVLQQQRYTKPSFLVYLLESFKTYSDMNIDYSLIFKDEYAEKIPGLIDGQRTDNEVNDEIGSEYVQGLFNSDFINNETYLNNDAYEPMRIAFAQNKVNAWATNTPLKLFYGTIDEWVPGDQTMELLKEFRSLGVGSNVEMKPLNGMDHLTAFPQTLFDTMNWFLSLTED